MAVTDQQSLTFHMKQQEECCLRPHIYTFNVEREVREASIPQRSCLIIYRIHSHLKGLLKSRSIYLLWVPMPKALEHTYYYCVGHILFSRFRHEFRHAISPTGIRSISLRV